jgi:hypothetical protein
VITSSLSDFLLDTRRVAQDAVRLYFEPLRLLKRAVQRALARLDKQRRDWNTTGFAEHRKAVTTPDWLSAGIKDRGLTDLDIRREARLVGLIPTHDDASTISGTLRLASEFADELVVLDFGSTDDTVSRALELSATIHRVQDVEDRAEGIRLGFREAERRGAKGILVIDPASLDFPEAADAVVRRWREGSADLVLGLDSSSYRRMSWPVRQASHLLERVAGVAFVESLSTPWIVSTGLVRRLRIESLHKGWLPDLVLMTMEMGGNIAKVEVKSSVASRSRLNSLAAILEVAREALRLRAITRRRGQLPVVPE